MSPKTPGVYVEEVSLFPASVAQVETSIPAFVGYTEIAEDGHGNSLYKIPTRIESMLEYEMYFGGPQAQAFEATLVDGPPVVPESIDFDGSETPYRMYPAMSMFFANGGGPCYIVSVGDFKNATFRPSLDNSGDANEIREGLEKIRKIDEVTLIVIPEATALANADQYNLYKEMLAQCNDLKDRFAIFDLRMADEDGSEFRNGIGTNFLSYGAAYYPHLNTSLSYSFTPKTVKFAHPSGSFDGLVLNEVRIVAKALNYREKLNDAKAKVDDANADAQDASLTKNELVLLLNIARNNAGKSITMTENALELIADETFVSTDLESANTLYESSESIDESDTKTEIKNAIGALKDAAADALAAINATITELNDPNQTAVPEGSNSDILNHFTNQFEAKLNRLLGQKQIIMPPSSVMAGIYAKVDADRGVWKAPANVSINRVSGPADKLTLSENDSFNVHPTGKSINVIRAFTGKGTLVWGARTLDGNSNEWRYISVRRFFSMVEESTKKASGQFVFESNDANTWVKVKAMIENFLILQWRAGALMGAKPEEAFFVKIGLGATMTQQDVLEGRMIVEIGMAVVRPAEFIILRFSHKMLES